MIQSRTEEDVMMGSVVDDFDMTREEENSLLEEEMAIDCSQPKESTTTDSSITRKPIVFDLSDIEDKTADEDNENGLRDKFRSERTTIQLIPNEPNTHRLIPDSLDSIQTWYSKRDKPELKRLKHLSKRQRRRQRGLGSGDRLDSEMNDLRQIIDSARNGRKTNRNYKQSIDPNLNNETGLTPLMDLQLSLGILNPTSAQNQLIVNALLAQRSTNPLINQLLRSTSMANNEPKMKKPIDDIQITVLNRDTPPIKANTGLTKTKPQIRCLAINDLSDSEQQLNNNQKPKFKTLFSQHLMSKASQSKANPEKSTGSFGGVFGSALAEAEIGVNNDYLQKMKEMERKRMEILEMKAQRRLEMADERLQSAEELQQKISNKRNKTFN